MATDQLTRLVAAIERHTPPDGVCDTAVPGLLLARQPTPTDPIEATGSLLAALGRGSVLPIGLGSVNGRYFLFHVGIGFDAAVVAQVERRNELKRYAGHPLFVASAFVTWFRHYDHRRPHFAIQIGDELVDGCYFAIVSKTSPYTFLGPRPVVVAPEADLDSRLSQWLHPGSVRF